MAAAGLPLLFKPGSVAAVKADYRLHLAEK